MIRILTIACVLLSWTTVVGQDRDVKFCNEYPRVSSTLLARAYFEGEELQAQWTATTPEDRMTVLGQSIINQARRMKNALIASRATANQWTAEGGVSLVPNDSTPISDGAPDDGRPAIVGSDVVGVITQVESYANWLDHGEYATTVIDSDNGAYRHAILAVAMSTPSDLESITAATIVTRCQQLSAEMEASSNARLNVLLAVAVIDSQEHQQ